jgi:uncharacterized protein
MAAHVVSPRSYRPAFWLRSGHLQTIWGRIAGRRSVIPYRRERWETPDDDFLDLLRIDGEAADAPTFLLLHGLEGGLHSPYIHGMLAQAAERGWQANVLLFRGCSGEPNRRPRAYHSGETGDLAFVVGRLQHERPAAPILLAGVSLGGNVLLKWLGEQGASIRDIVAGATAISAPFDLARSCRHIDARGRFYARRFLKSLRAKALAKVLQFPGSADVDAIRAAETLWAFDDAFTSVVHGFTDAADYYAQSSSVSYLDGIRVPTLLLSARDDPFYPPDLLDGVWNVAQGNPALHLEFVEVGGHVGFIEGSVPWRTSSYCERRAIEFGSEHLAAWSSAG